MKQILFILLSVIYCQANALHPSREYKVLPSKFGMTYKEEKIAQKDGAILNGWFFEQPKKTTNWVVISASGDGNM